MNKYKTAAILMIIHGGLMELGGCLLFIAAMIMGTDAFSTGQYFSFIVPYFQENLILLIIMGGIYGLVRLIGAIALLKNKMWGLALSVINCIVTMILMIFMLPAGIMDGILACSALILILIEYFNGKNIVDTLN